MCFITIYNIALVYTEMVIYFVNIFKVGLAIQGSFLRHTRWYINFFVCCVVSWAGVEPQLPVFYNYHLIKDF